MLLLVTTWFYLCGIDYILLARVLVRDNRLYWVYNFIIAHVVSEMVLFVQNRLYIVGTRIVRDNRLDLLFVCWNSLMFGCICTESIIYCWYAYCTR